MYPKNQLKKLFLTLIACMSFSLVIQAADTEKIEVTPFGGGFFSFGFPTADYFSPPSVIRFKPLNETNNGIFGVRSSYDITPRFTVEGAFAFSPAGRKRTFFFFPGPDATAPVLFRGRSDGSTLLYNGNFLINLKMEGSWKPFLTVGFGAITRTGIGGGLISGPFPGPIYGGGLITQTDLALNYGVGVKKYFSKRIGLRIDVRDYISKFPAGGYYYGASNIVHNLETSAGLIFRF